MAASPAPAPVAKIGEVHATVHGYGFTIGAEDGLHYLTLSFPTKECAERAAKATAAAIKKSVALDVTVIEVQRSATAA